MMEVKYGVVTNKVERNNYSQDLSFLDVFFLVRCFCSPFTFLPSLDPVFGLAIVFIGPDMGKSRLGAYMIGVYSMTNNVVVKKPCEAGSELNATSFRPGNAGPQNPDPCANNQHPMD